MSDTEALHKELEALQERFQLSLHAANQVWWEWDMSKGRLYTHTEGQQCILGYDTTVCDQHEEFWWKRIHEDDLELVRETLDMHFTGKTEIWTCDHRYAGPNGEYKWIKGSGIVTQRDQDNKPSHMIGITQLTHQSRVREISLLEETQKLTAILSNVPAAIYVFNANTYESTYLSDQAAEVFGCTTKELRMVGDSIFQLIHPEDQERVKQVWDMVLKFSKPNPEPIDFRILSKGGKERTVRAFHSRNARPDTDQQEIIGVAVPIKQ